MSVWRCPRCGSVTVVEPRYGEVIAVYDLCAASGDLRAGRTTVRMELTDPSVLDQLAREPELVASR